MWLKTQEPRKVKNKNQGKQDLSERIDQGFPGGASDKEPACQCRRLKRYEFNSWVRNIPWRREWQLTPIFLSGKSNGQGYVVGYGHGAAKQLDNTERLNNNNFLLVSQILISFIFSFLILSIFVDFYLYSFTIILAGFPEE